MGRAGGAARRRLLPRPPQVRLLRGDYASLTSFLTPSHSSLTPLTPLSPVPQNAPLFETCELPPLPSICRWLCPTHHSGMPPSPSPPLPSQVGAAAARGARRGGRPPRRALLRAQRAALDLAALARPPVRAARSERLLSWWCGHGTASHQHSPPWAAGPGRSSQEAPTLPFFCCVLTQTQVQVAARRRGARDRRRHRRSLLLDAVCL